MAELIDDVAHLLHGERTVVVLLLHIGNEHFKQAHNIYFINNENGQLSLLITRKSKTLLPSISKAIQM